MKLIKHLFALLVIFQSLISCSPKSLTPNFKIGMEENVWRDPINSMRKRAELNAEKNTDSLSFKFKITIGDTILNATIGINNDGISKGKLRVLTLNFLDTAGIINTISTDPIYPSPLADSIQLYNSYPNFTYMDKNNQPRITHTIGAVFYISAYQKVFAFLKKSFGQPDSVLDNNNHRLDTVDFAKHKVQGGSETKVKNGWDLDLIGVDAADFKRIDSIKAKMIDTSSLSYYFHDDKSIIVFERSRFNRANYFMPFPYTTKAYLYQYSKSYEQELIETQSAILKGMRPSDLITIPLYYDVEKKKMAYGLELTYLNVRRDLDPSLRKTRAEPKEIESMKGKILISDKYGSILQEMPDIEIQAHGSLTSISRPGLDYAIGNGASDVYHLYNYGLSIYVGHKDISNALKQAVAMNSSLSIEFVPNVILFTDGSVLK